MKVFIPCAGEGSRLGMLTKHYNKAMLAIGKKPVISLIIDLYPRDAEFVIALGFGGHYLEQLLKLAYSQRKMTIVYVDKFKGEGSGLSYTMQCAKEHLQCPFFFHSNDTLFTTKIRELDEDTMFVSNRYIEPKSYRSVSLKCGLIKQIYDKTEEEIHEDIYTYIGTTFIKSFEQFWYYMEGQTGDIGEIYGLTKLLSEKRIEANIVPDWYDIGDINKYKDALTNLSDFENLSKEKESIYFIGDKVYKFSIDEKFIQNRVDRAEKLEGLVPQIVSSSKNLYTYKYVEGELLSCKIITEEVFKHLLEWSKENLWRTIQLDIKKQDEFEHRCFDFYYNKTEQRINEYFQKYNIIDKQEEINDKVIAPLKFLFGRIDWLRIKNGVPVVFHGDFHFENILKHSGGYTLLDWRQDFAGYLDYGDIYYDFAKLYHGIIINHKVIRDSLFTVEDNHFTFHQRYDLCQLKSVFRQFINNNGFDWYKVEVLTALIFLNVAPLHHYPYSKLLFSLGRFMLNEITQFSH